MNQAFGYQMNPEYQRELLSFDEKIALAELEASKAEGRVREIKYRKTRFCMDYMMAALKAQQDAKKEENNAG